MKSRGDLGRRCSISGRSTARKASVGNTPVVAKVRRNKTDAYTANWAAISKAVITAHPWCSACGVAHKTLKASGGRLEVHHIVPVAKGGLTVTGNLKVLCSLCHEKKTRLTTPRAR